MVNINNRSVNELLDDILFEVSYIDRPISNGSMLNGKSEDYANGFKDALQASLDTIRKHQQETPEEKTTPKLNKGDRVKIVLSRPYSEEEIREFGCDPNVDGKTATVSHEIKTDLYALRLDEVLPVNPLHADTQYEGDVVDIYNESIENLVKISF